MSSGAGELLSFLWPNSLKSSMPSSPHTLQPSSPAVPLLGPMPTQCLLWHPMCLWMQDIALGMSFVLSLTAHLILPEGKDGPSSLCLKQLAQGLVHDGTQ